MHSLFHVLEGPDTSGSICGNLFVFKKNLRASRGKSRDGKSGQDGTGTVRERKRLRYFLSRPMFPDLSRYWFLFPRFPSHRKINCSRPTLFPCHFPCSADHEQDWQPYPVDPYSAICDDHKYILSAHSLPIPFPFPTLTLFLPSHFPLSVHSLTISFPIVESVFPSHMSVVLLDVTLT